MLLLVVFISISVYASGFKIEGAIWKEKVSPGGSITKEINISIDPDDAETEFTIGVAGLEQTLQGINRPLSASNDTSPYTALPFISVSPVSFLLKPGGSQTVTAKADIPIDVGSGTRFAILSLRTIKAATSAEIDGNRRVGVSTGSNIPVVLTINGSEFLMTGEITDLEIEDPISVANQNVSLILKNTGNTQYLAKVKVQLKDEKNNSLVSSEMDSGVQAIVPPFSRLFELSLVPEASLEPGSYKIIVSAELEDGTVLDTQEIGFEI